MTYSRLFFLVYKPFDLPRINGIDSFDLVNLGSQSCRIDIELVSRVDLDKSPFNEFYISYYFLLLPTLYNFRMRRGKILYSGYGDSSLSNQNPTYLVSTAILKFPLHHLQSQFLFPSYKQYDRIKTLPTVGLDTTIPRAHMAYRTTPHPPHRRDLQLRQDRAGILANELQTPLNHHRRT